MFAAVIIVCLCGNRPVQCPSVALWSWFTRRRFYTRALSTLLNVQALVVRVSGVSKNVRLRLTNGHFQVSLHASHRKRFAFSFRFARIVVAFCIEIIIIITRIRAVPKAVKINSSVNNATVKQFLELSNFTRTKKSREYRTHLSKDYFPADRK